MSDQYSQIDVSEPNEPDYETRFTMRRDEDWEAWVDNQAPTNEELDKRAEYYEHQRTF